METSAVKKFGRYEILAELGRGAMGVVYKARDPQIDRLVAVKTVSLWAHQSEEEREFRLRFLNEAQAAGRLHHPGIVSVFDVGEGPDNNDPYIVLEYVAGESLARILARQRKLEVAKALKIAEEIADALDYAHAQGVVHRDIKPANILITEDGHAKIADFGIAKLNLAHFTLPGRVLGTPAYMAPEQLSGEGADGRSDLFSLGVILYVMTTGLSPFQGDSATTVCFKVANREPVDASALDLSLPPQLDPVISRAIAKNPEERYQTGAEFANDLRSLLQQYKSGTTTTSLRAVPSAGAVSAAIRTGQMTASEAQSAKAADQVRKAVHYVLFKAPVRDLVLGAAGIVLLVIIAAQTKLLIAPSRPGVVSLDAAPSVRLNASSNANAGQPSSPVSMTPVPTVDAAPVVAKLGKMHSKVSHPVKASQPPEVVVPTANVELAIQHQFKDATLFVSLDDKLVLTRPLHGGEQKKLVVFNGVRGAESETLQIPAGQHVLLLRAVSTDHTADLSKTISADFAGGDDKVLHVIFDKHNAVMHLSWQEHP